MLELRQCKKRLCHCLDAGAHPADLWPTVENQTLGSTVKTALGFRKQNLGIAVENEALGLVVVE